MDRSKYYNEFCTRVETMPEAQYNELGLCLKAWYGEAYPSDDLVSVIMDDVTLYDIVDSIYCKRDVYIYIPDSIVRERVFAKIAEITSLSYDTVYEAWLAA